MAESLLVACPSCNTLNRAPREKLAAGASGKCGNCGSPLFGGHPVALERPELRDACSQERHPPAGRLLGAVVRAVQGHGAAVREGRRRARAQVRLAKVNTEDEQALAGRFGIQAIPTMILFKHGKEVARQSGAMNAAGIESWVQQALR